MPTTELNLITGQRVDIQVYQGNTIQPTFTFKDSNNDPIDLTGVLVEFQARKCEDSADPMVAWSTVNGKISITGTDNNIVVLNGIIDLPGATYKYDIRFTYPSPDSRIVVYLYGDLHVFKKVSRTIV